MPNQRFDNEKAQAMRKLIQVDKSKKGSIDTDIAHILDLINSHPDYYTTSSCSGRIMILSVSKERRKDESEWLYTSHEKAKPRGVIQAIKSNLLKELWLRQEPAIIHIACRDLKSAERILGTVREAGFKRAGIISTGRRVMIEVIGTDSVSMPVSSPGSPHVSEDFIRYAVEKCNERMESNNAKLCKLKAGIKGRIIKTLLIDSNPS